MRRTGLVNQSLSGCAGGVLQGIVGEDLQPKFRLVSVDFLDIQFFHERQDIGADDLSWDQNGESRWIGNDEARRNDLPTVGYCLFQLLVIDLHVLTILFFIGKEKCFAKVSFLGSGARPWTERFMKMAEIWKRWKIPG